MRIGVGQIHRAPSPSMYAMVRRPGMGQAAIGPFTPLDQYLANWFAELSGEPQGDAAVGCGTGGGLPCTSAEDAAGMVYTIAANQCQLETNDATMAGYQPDPQCADGGQATASALYPQVLSFFQAFPQSVWDTAAANLAANTPYGPEPTNPCGTGTASYVNGVMTCRGSNAAVDVGQAANPPVTATPISQTPASVVTPVAAPVSTTGTAIVPVAVTGATTSTTDDFAFLTQSVFGGIPNWALLAGGLALVLILPSLLGGRR